jgi:hypothetical protein
MLAARFAGVVFDDERSVPPMIGLAHGKQIDHESHEAIG